MNLTRDQLLELGLSKDRDTLRRRIAVAAEAIGFGLFAGVLIRGDFHSGRAWVESVTNTPAGFAEAQRTLNAALRDPVMTALSAGPRMLQYDQSTYVQASAVDLWDLQSAFGYRVGIACSLHQASHLEQFAFGVDREVKLPDSPAERMRLTAEVQMLMLHAQAAMTRLYTPATNEAPELSARELECLKWARDGKTAWQSGELLAITAADVVRHRASAAAKLGAPSLQAAVLRCIEGGRIEG